MANNTKQLEEFLDKQLERVNEWLTFAEAKHAALIAFNIAAIAIMSDFREDYLFLSTLITLGFVASTLCSLWSFAPKTPSHPDQETNSTTPQEPNLVFWLDIGKTKNEAEYIELVQKRYLTDNEATQGGENLCSDLACEVVINSQIASRKYKLFNQALKIDFFAFAIVIILLIVA